MVVNVVRMRNKSKSRLVARRSLRVELSASGPQHGKRIYADSSSKGLVGKLLSDTVIVDNGNVYVITRRNR